ncbi:hypothetical protein [Archangium sp.]|uniref:hypothetical protein n=1 Tax=Archangium sp. TaxID=1872627 RepID=UPI00389A77EB
MNYLAADRDAGQFSEPNRFDVGRTPNKHVGLGQGIHVCLGAPLARLEAAAAFELLLERLPEMRLATEPEKLAWRPSAQARGLVSSRRKEQGTFRSRFVPTGTTIGPVAGKRARSLPLTGLTQSGLELLSETAVERSAPRADRAPGDF